MLSTVLALAALGGDPGQARCAGLKAAAPPQAQVASAVWIDAPHKINLGAEGVDATARRPFCRVAAILTPTADSRIKVEVWLPAREGWNGKYVQTGNGGFAGSLNEPYGGMTKAMNRGFAAAATDTGHEGGDASWAVGHPEKVRDFGYRAEHLTAVFAKHMIKGFYGTPVAKAYFQGCSNGGREALMEVQRYPEDFDGVIAGAPAASFTDVVSAFAWSVPIARTLPRDQDLWWRIAPRVTADCADPQVAAAGVILNPAACRPNLAALRCGGAPCLNPGQIAAMHRLYSGPPGASVGARAGIMPGSEADWLSWLVGDNAGAQFYGQEFFRHMLFGDPAWTVDKADYARDRKLARERMGPILNATDPDISKFTDRGGRLILWHGLADAGLPPQPTLDYYTAVRSTIGAEKTDRSVRLFMAPGIGHCIGGPGPDLIDLLAALDDWVVRGKDPQSLLAVDHDDKPNVLSRWQSDEAMGAPRRSRPLCAYPAAVRYVSGDPKQAGSYRCAAP